MADDRVGRPRISTVRDEVDVLGWYWLRSELVQIARAHDVATGGSKQELSQRIADTLAGRPPTPPRRRARTSRLTGDLDDDTVIPPGQPCSELLRQYFVARLGSGFRFDSAMRTFIAVGGTTLGDACQHWHDSRGRKSDTIGDQFEYNRFTRSWMAAHPGGRREALLAAWWEHRSAPRPVPGARPSTGSGATGGGSSAGEGVAPGPAGE